MNIFSNNLKLICIRRCLGLSQKEMSKKMFNIGMIRYGQWERLQARISQKNIDMFEMNISRIEPAEKREEIKKIWYSASL